MFLDLVQSSNPWGKKDSQSEAYDCPCFLPGDKFQSTMQEVHPKQSLATLSSWGQRERLEIGRWGRLQQTEGAEYRVEGAAERKLEVLQKSLLGAFAEF